MTHIVTRIYKKDDGSTETVSSFHENEIGAWQARDNALDVSDLSKLVFIYISRLEHTTYVTHDGVIGVVKVSNKHPLFDK